MTWCCLLILLFVFLFVKRKEHFSLTQAEQWLKTKGYSNIQNLMRTGATCVTGEKWGVPVRFKHRNKTLTHCVPVTPQSLPSGTVPCFSPGLTSKTSTILIKPCYEGDTQPEDNAALEDRKEDVLQKLFSPSSQHIASGSTTDCFHYRWDGNPWGNSHLISQLNGKCRGLFGEGSEVTEITGVGCLPPNEVRGVCSLVL